MSISIDFSITSGSTASITASGDLSGLGYESATSFPELWTLTADRGYGLAERRRCLGGAVRGCC